MNLDSTQLATLKTWLAENASSLNDSSAADSLNVTSSPDFWVWRTDVSPQEINETVDWSEVVALTTNAMLAFNSLKDQTVLDTSKLSIRQAFNSIFPSGGNPNTNAALIEMARRLSTVGESVLATGTGSISSPATMGNGAEGLVSQQNVVDARNS